MSAAPQRTAWPSQRVLFVVIVALAAVIRLWNIGGQPVLYFDSGVYLGEGAFLSSVVERGANALVSTGSVGEMARTLQDGTDAHPPDIAKPAHAILLGIGMLLLGKTALAGQLVSALAGIGTVAFTYLIGKRAFGLRVAAVGAVLLAVSGQHLVYSREPLVEADGLFFAMAASYVYLVSRSSKGLLLSGALWGISFACNNRLSYLPLVLLVAELADWGGLRNLIRRAVAIGVGGVIPLVLIEGAYLAARGVARATQTRADWLDYAQQLAAFSRMNPPDRLRFDQWPTYFVDTALMDGLPVLVLLLIGIPVLIVTARARRSRDVWLVAASLLVPLALYSVYSTGEVRLRHFSLAIPWVMLTAALGLDWLASLTRRYARPVLVGATALIALSAIPRIAALDSAPDGMPNVLAFAGSQPVASTNGPVQAFFSGEDRSNARLRPAFVNVPADLAPLAKDYPRLVVDMQAAVFPGELTDIYARATPQLVVSNGNDAWYLADLLEHYGSNWGGWNDLLARWQANRDIASQLRVYSLSELTQLAE